MSRHLPLLCALVLTGCAGEPTTVIQVQSVRWPDQPPPVCDDWDRRALSDFELNTDLIDDWLIGQAAYGRCRELTQAYRRSWRDWSNVGPR